MQVLGEPFQGAEGDAELGEVFEDGAKLHNEIAQVENDEGPGASLRRNEWGDGDAAAEHKDACELAQDAVDALLALKLNVRRAPGSQAAGEEVDDHEHTEHGKDVEHAAFGGGAGAFEGVEEPGCWLSEGDGDGHKAVSFLWG